MPEQTPKIKPDRELPTPHDMLLNPESTEGQLSMSHWQKLKKPGFVSYFKWLIIILLLLFIISLLYIIYTIYLGYSSPIFSDPIPYLSPTATPSSIPFNPPANWNTYRNESLQYEFDYPPNPLVPMEGTDDASFVIGYFLNAGNPNEPQDIQNTYWIRLGYISQSQLSVMGVTYCGAYPNDTSRCESLTIGGQRATIDWNIPAEYTKINSNGKEEKTTQVKASAWIPHPLGGIVTFELQPVVAKSKRTLNKILSTFKFLPASPSQGGNQQITPNPKDAVVCTMDALLCPDGSSVGRIGPNCEFARCPVSTDKSPDYTGKSCSADASCPIGYTCNTSGTCIKQ